MKSSSRKISFTEELKKAYELYFNATVITEVNWAPSFMCKTCYNAITDWLHEKRTAMPFGMPMYWMDPGLHDELNCYVCANYEKGLNKQKLKTKIYKSVLSAQTPLPHNDDIPIPNFPSPDVLSTLTGLTGVFSTQTVDHSLYDPGPSISQTIPKEPVLITQQKLNHIIAKLELSKRKSEELSSFLKANNLLAPGTKVTLFRNRQKELQALFTANEEKTFAYCNDVEQLFCSMGVTYNADDWRIFIDSSKYSLKAVLLHKSNDMPSMPIAYSTDTKETYEKMQQILQLVEYNKHEWRICCDLKVVAMLCGLQGGYTKHMCFLCDWDSRFKGNQYDMHKWKCRDESVHKNANVLRDPLVPKEKILLPPLHVKLGIVKSFVKTIAKRDEVYDCLHQIFPRLSKDKLMNGK